MFPRVSSSALLISLTSRNMYASNATGRCLLRCFISDIRLPDYRSQSYLLQTKNAKINSLSILRPFSSSGVVVAASTAINTPAVTETATATATATSTPSGPKVTFASHPYPINGAPIDMSTPSLPVDRFAIVEFSGTQYKVALDDTIVADLQPDIDIGDVISLDKVMMVGSRKGTLMGMPYIEGAKVMAAVEEISKDKKLIIFKLRRRKNSRRKKGFRRSVTVLRIQNIVLDEQHKEFNEKL